jgi:type I restriction enzyme S subunit
MAMTSDAPQVRDGSPRCGATTHAQDLPPGYKRTEVGVIPEDWHAGELGEAISDLLAGVSVNSTTGEVDHGVPAILKTSCVESGTFLPHEAKPIAPKDRRRAKLNPRRDTILISRMNTIELVGECGFVDRDHPDLFIPDRLWMTQIRSSSSVSARWFAAVLSSAPYRRQLQSIATGTSGSMKNIAKHSLLGLQVAYPRHDEQRAIAEALSDVDGLLGALEALIAKKRAIKQAAMQQLLTGKTRLPGFSGEWETKRLGEIAHIKTGSRNNEDKVTDGHYPFFVRSEFVERIDTFSYDCEAILVPGEGRIGEIFHYMQGRFDVHQRVYAITRFAPEVCGRFVYFHMAMQFGSWAMQNTVKATVDSLRLPTFKNFAMSVPPTVAEQTAIATVLSDMDAEIAALEARRDKTRGIKRGMMQQLLTGRVRLVKPEAAA